MLNLFNLFFRNKTHFGHGPSPHGKGPLNVRYLLGATLGSIFLVFYAVSTDQTILFPLIASWCLYSWVLRRSGLSANAILQYSKEGFGPAMKVIQVLACIGPLIALWQAAGTLPSLIVYSLTIIVPSLFVISAFLLTTIISVATGSSFGAVGTLGLAMIMLARLGNVPIELIAGAVISGAYIGDRNSPMSSSAALVAALTGTTVRGNLKPMFLSSLPALVLTTLLYGLISFAYPLQTIDLTVWQTLHDSFVITPWALLPIIVLFGLIAGRCSVKIAMIISALFAAAIAILVQQDSITNLVHYLLQGFTLPASSPLVTIIKGGGWQSMIMPALIILVASCLSSLLDKAGVLQVFQQRLLAFTKHSHLFAVNCLISLFIAAIGCSQAVACILGFYLLRVVYAKSNVTDEMTAIDFENTGIVLAPLIPWNIAAYVPTVMMGVSMTGYWPYAFFLFLLPITYGAQLYYKERTTLKY